MPEQHTEGITILHLSDIHRTEDEPVTNSNILEALVADLHRQQEQEGLPKPDLLVISGDLTQSADKDEYEDAYNLIDALKNELTVPDVSRVILVPGNHDVNWAICENIFKSGRRKPPKVDEALVFTNGQFHWWTDQKKYAKRLQPFRTLYERLYGREYGAARKDQFDVWPFPDLGVYFVGLNSCDLVDNLRFRGSINEEAFFAASKRLQELSTQVAHCIKIAIWHHDLNWLGRIGQEDCLDPSILGHLVDAGYDLALCGHTHRTDFNVYTYPGFRLPIVAAGSLCAGPRQRQESIPRLYNLIHIQGNMARVHTRLRETKDVPWRPYARWGTLPQSYFDVSLSKAEAAAVSKPQTVAPEERTVQALAQGFAQVYESLEKIVATLHASGYDVHVDKAGGVVIGEDMVVGARLERSEIQRLQAEIVRLREAIAGHELIKAELQVLEDRYRQHLIRWFDRLTFQGMMRTARVVSLPLEDVYVELRAVAEVPEAADVFSVEERRLLLEGEHQDPEARRELFRQLDALRRERWSVKIPERKSICQALHAGEKRACVILGDPGSGKTTLLHLLALVYAKGPDVVQRRLGVPAAEADRLPIFVPLAAYDDMQRETPGLSLLEFLARYYDRRRGLPGLGPLFQRALESGRALVLLDGLDEVLDVSARSMVAEQAKALIGEWVGRGVRFAVTSRFVGYREAPLSGDLPHLSVLDFRQEEIEIFVHKWTLAFEKFAVGLPAEADPTPEVLRVAHQHETDLLTDMRSNPGVQRLAANPLMLTMLALLRRQVGRLPHRRILLYERYVSTLIENWIEARSHGERAQPVLMLDLHDAESILIPLALWLQQNKLSGTAGKAEIRSELMHIFLEEAGHLQATATRPQVRKAEEKAEHFLHDMRHMAGLIVERGQDAFGFLHLTFQEYFAGRALARLTDEKRWQAVLPHLHDPRWREPILLCAGWLGVVEKRREQVSDLVRRILHCADDTEPDLHRKLLLALAIAADDVNLAPALLNELVQCTTACLPTNVCDLAAEFVSRIGRLVANDAAEAETCFAPIWTSKDATLRATGTKALADFLTIPSIHVAVLARLEDKEGYVQSVAVSALGSVVGSDAEVRAAVLTRLVDEDSDVRRAAVSALGGIVGSDAEVQAAVLARLTDEDYNVRLAVARALRGVVESDTKVRAAVLAQLADEDSDVRSVAMVALGSVVESEADVRAAVLARLADEEWPVRGVAVAALGSVVESEADVRAAVLARLVDEEWFVRFMVVLMLRGVVGSDTEVRAAALARLADKKRYVRSAAVSALGSVVGSDAEVRTAVLARLADEDSNVQSAAVEVLAELAGTDAEVYQAIRDQLETRDWSVRQAVGQALGDTLSSAQVRSDEILGVLVFLQDSLETVESVGFQTRALDVLVELMGSDAEVRAAVLARLADEDSDVRRAAVRALTDVVGSDTEVRAAVLARLADKDSNARSAAVEALAGVAGSDTEVRAAVLARLADEEGDVRSAAVRALAGMAGSDAEVRAAVLARLEDKNDDVRGAAVRALTDVVGSDTEVRAAALARLEDEAGSVRGAAVEALAGVVGSDTEVRAAVLARLADDVGSVRGAAAKALAAWEAADIVSTELSALALWLLADFDERYLSSEQKDDIEKTRMRLAALVGARLPQDGTLRDWVWGLLTDSRWSARLGAVLALLHWPGGPPREVIQRILAALDDERGLESYPARLTAASYLINRDPYSQMAVEVCLQALDYGTQPWEYLPRSGGIRQQAALVLGKLEPLHYDPHVYEKLRHVMCNDQDAGVRDAIYGALVRLAAVRESAGVKPCGDMPEFQAV